MMQSPAWLQDVIVSQTGPELCKIKLEDDRLIRCHVIKSEADIASIETEMITHFTLLIHLMIAH